MRKLLLLAVLFLNVALLGQAVGSSPSQSFSNSQREQAQPVPASPSATEAITSQCPSTQKPPQNAADAHAKVTGGRLIHKVAPKYPAHLKKAHVEGTVLMCATIGTDGKIHDLITLSGPTELVPYARDAVEQWRYKPYRVNKEPVEVDSEIRVVFPLMP